VTIPIFCEGETELALKPLLSKAVHNKVKDGQFFLENANWETIYDRCHVFKALIDELTKDCSTVS
jgi:hypothetical protein